ncbi:MAG: type II secretion system F family protein [Candidatus Omnitrophica bacterium]|nr:type II secretion system F family protein [Candidatus Omnitrophota bacterium]
MIVLIFFLIFVSVGILVYTLWPVVATKAQAINEGQAQKMALRSDLYLLEDDLQKTYTLALLAPLVFGVGAFILFPSTLRLAGLVVGVVLGIVLPRLYVNALIAKRKLKFNDQLIDALMIMSSSFRGGLSLVQSIEAVIDEMPNPIKREFGVVLGENKMGVVFDESLNRLAKRMPSVALQQMITAILLARETGGNLPVIFSRIINTMRERKKIEQSLKMLTVQGKIQAVVMTGLPILFVMGVSASNPRFFDIMFRIPQGQQMLMVCAVLWMVGAFFIWQISKFKDF